MYKKSHSCKKWEPDQFRSTLQIWSLLKKSWIIGRPKRPIWTAAALKRDMKYSKYMKIWNILIHRIEQIMSRIHKQTNKQMYLFQNMKYIIYSEIYSEIFWNILFQNIYFREIFITKRNFFWILLYETCYGLFLHFSVSFQSKLVLIQQNSGNIFRV